MFYESKHLMTADYFSPEYGENFSFPPHLHGSFEIIVIEHGQMHVQIDANTYVLSEGEAVLIFPNQVHSMKTETSSRHILCVFSPMHIKKFAKEKEGQIPLDNKFSPSDNLRKSFAHLTKETNLYTLKGILYSLCGEFDSVASYFKRSSKEDNDLLRRIFKFVTENYSSKCSLGDLAANMSYDYYYLSKFFKRKTGISYNDYVNQHRINESCYLLRNTDMSILDICSECGYVSLRNYNQNFQKQMNMTPSEYRHGR